MIRSNLEVPRVPDGWLDGASDDSAAPQQKSPEVQLASTLDYDGATRRLTLTRSDGTVQEFPANNNPDSTSRGRWPNGTFNYERHTIHSDDAPESRYGSNGNYQFAVPGRPYMGVHSGREGQNDGLGRSGVNHATNGCIRTTDDGTTAIRDAMGSDDPVNRITVRNNE